MCWWVCVRHERGPVSDGACDGHFCTQGRVLISACSSPLTLGRGSATPRTSDTKNESIFFGENLLPNEETSPTCVGILQRIMVVRSYERGERSDEGWLVAE